MIAVQFPDFEADSLVFFRECVGTTRPVPKRARLRGAIDEVGRAIGAYVDLASTQRLNEVPQVDTTFSTARHSDFESLYASYMVSLAGAGREYYEMIRSAPDSGICPFCATRKVETVDHFLPKTYFPQYCIAFENLVGCCTDCNRFKLDRLPATAADVFFHPYYERFPEQEWLVVKILHENPIEATFSVATSIECYDRVENHFTELRLSEIYAVRAGSEIASLLFYFGKVLDHDGSDGLSAFLLGLAESARRQKFEPWKQVLFTALADDNWFCNGGFR